MDKTTRYALTLLLLLAATLGFAQQKQAVLLNIRGTVYENQTLQPMEGAGVKLLNERDSMVAGAVTKRGGQFLLPGIPAQEYTLQVSFMGYKTQKFRLTLPQKSGNYKVADVMMREDATLMAEAVVEGKLPEMTVVDDTVVYNADAFMLPDGTGMLFASDRKGGYNLQPSYSFFHGDRAVASDIYFAPFSNGHWGKPVNLGFDINSPYMECSPVISDDLTTLYFITDCRGLGFGDIYIATRDNIDDWTSWSKPVNYGKEVNSCRNEKSISMASATNSLLINSNKGGHYGCYKAPLYHTINSDFTNVEIKAGEVGFSADIVDVATRKSVGHPINVKQQSAWTGLLRSNQQYLLYAHQQGLYMPAICFTPAKNAKPTPEVYSLSRLLAMADEEHPLPLEGILFVDGQATLESCSMKELDHLADLLQRNTNVGVEVSCHVDAADDAASFRLSQERANRVKEELVARGIHPDRIATSPYGNSYTKRGLTNSSITITLLRL